MKKNKSMEEDIDKNPTETIESFNGRYTALPKDAVSADDAAADADLVATTMDYGDMNLADAKASGYTDKTGHAVSSATKKSETNARH